MRRREFIGLFGGAAAASAWPARAQQAMPRVGVLLVGGAATPKDLALAPELARLGYVEGRNIAFDIRGADGELDRLPALARELVAAKPSVLIGATTAIGTAAHALRASPWSVMGDSQRKSQWPPCLADITCSELVGPRYL